MVDDYTAKVVFKEPNGAFLNTVANSSQFSPSSPTALQADPAGFGQHPVGTGPFVFKEWVVDDHVTVVQKPGLRLAVTGRSRTRDRPTSTK